MGCRFIFSHILKLKKLRGGDFGDDRHVPATYICLRPPCRHRFVMARRRA